MKELNVTIDDYEHRINRKIANHKDDPDFPKLADFNITQKQLDDYLYDYQAVLDSKGSQRTRLTVGGVLFVIPPLVMSAIPESNLPWGEASLYVSLAMGAVLAAAGALLQQLVIYLRLKKMSQQQIERYLTAVKNF